MAAAVAAKLRGGLLPQAGWLPTLQTVRHGSKAVTRHRRVMHFQRQKLMAVTEYIPPKPAISPRCLPPPPKPPKEESALIRLLRQEIAVVFRDNRMIAVCQNVAMSTEDKLLIRHQLQKHKISMKIFPNEVLRPFLKESKYQNLLPLFVGHNLLLVSEEPKAKEMVRILKSVPFMPLLVTSVLEEILGKLGALGERGDIKHLESSRQVMDAEIHTGGCIDDTILSREGFINYAKLPSLTLLQGELVGGLTLLTTYTHSLLRHQPIQLTALLDQYVTQQQAGDSVVSASGKADPPDAAPDS